MFGPRGCLVCVSQWVYSVVTVSAGGLDTAEKGVGKDYGRAPEGHFAGCPAAGCQGHTCILSLPKGFGSGHHRLRPGGQAKAQRQSERGAEA